MKKSICLLLAAGLIGSLASCTPKSNLKIERPAVDQAYTSFDEATAAGGGWYQTMIEDFDQNTMPELWHTSPHGLRKTEYWCDNMVNFEDGNCVISAAYLEDNQCEVCPKEGEFTSGIETRYMNGDESIQSFAQAYGYYEARVKIPDAEGMWAAFWIQSNFQRKVGNDGRDGTEIDVFESAFKSDPETVGHALLWDGYGKSGKVADKKINTGTNLYDGYHTYGLLWTPTEYVFFVDGKATWKTDKGGVSSVPEFLRFTCEIRHGYGPHGVKLKEFNSTAENPAKFYVDYVKVYQNTDYLQHIKSDDDFTGLYDEAN